MKANTKIRHDSIRNDLTAECSFAHAWDKLDYTNHSPYEMGYIRAYHNFGGWSESWFNLHPMLITKERWNELFAVASALTKAFPTLTSLECFCSMIAEGRDGEYNLYYTGTEASYWIRVIPRPGDYNLYIHSIVLEGS